MSCAGQEEHLRPAAELDASGARAITGSLDAFVARSRADLARARDAVARLKSAPAAAPALQRLADYDDAMAALSDASARASVARNAHPDEAMRKAAETCEQEVDALATRFSLDRDIYRSLYALDVSTEDAATRHFLSRTLRDFRRAGVDKDEATRERVRELNEELVRIGQEFSRNIREDVRRIYIDPAELAGLPDDYVRAHRPGPDGKVSISTDYPDYVPFLTYAKSSRAREALWRVYRKRGHPGNLEVLSRMLALRHELAQLLGYPSWADYVTEDKMIGSAGAARAFIARISEASARRAAADYETLLERLRRDQPSAPRVEPWDAEVLKESMRAERFGFDAQSVRPYFPFARVQQGVLDVTARLFGLEYRRVEGAEVWHPDVTRWDVREKGALVGRFYLDLHPREGKYKHAAQFTLVSGQAGRRLPEAVLICNFPRPGPDNPALLEHGEVITFFHEFGHLLHHLLGGRTRWAGLSGVRTEWDFVEAPSQMLEEWCWDADVLRSFALHSSTGAPIPADLVERMKAADELGKGLRVRQQMFYAAVSLGFHERDPAEIDTTQLAAHLQETYTPFRAVEDTYFHESFGHLEGYSAIYYTYMWSLVIAKDLFTRFRGEGLMSEATAARYRREILEPGGSRPAAELVREFLGRAYNAAAYEEWLNAG
ncbi:MAG TPA: M3 family metallopeptidase [Myxococcales bacterium]|nr:M3 family metallopeptidase [Myxococcales bacterium]